MHLLHAVPNMHEANFHMVVKPHPSISDRKNAQAARPAALLCSNAHSDRPTARYIRIDLNKAPRNISSAAKSMASRALG